MLEELKTSSAYACLETLSHGLLECSSPPEQRHDANMAIYRKSIVLLDSQLKAYLSEDASLDKLKNELIPSLHDALLKDGVTPEMVVDDTVTAMIEYLVSRQPLSYGHERSPFDTASLIDYGREVLRIVHNESYEKDRFHDAMNRLIYEIKKLRKATKRQPIYADSHEMCAQILPLLSSDSNVQDMMRKGLFTRFLLLAISYAVRANLQFEATLINGNS